MALDVEMVYSLILIKISILGSGKMVKNTVKVLIYSLKKEVI